MRGSSAAAHRTLPALGQHSRLLGTYAGLRPATEHRDYQLHAARRWLCAAGIRSTGLTASLGCVCIRDSRAWARHSARDAWCSCCGLVFCCVLEHGATYLSPGSHRVFTVACQAACRGLTKFSIAARLADMYSAMAGQAGAAGAALGPAGDAAHGPVADDVQAEFRRRGDGTCTLAGHRFRVTHPLSAWGMAEDG